MDKSEPVGPGTSLSALGSAFAALREPVLAHWSGQVRAEIVPAQRLSLAALFDTFEILHTNLAEALSSGSARAFATSGTTLSAAHGRERACNSDYLTHDVVHELQLFREAVFQVAAERGLALSSLEAGIIERSLEQAIRDAVCGYAAVMQEGNEAFVANLSHDLRNPLNIASATAQLVGLKAEDPGIAGMARRIVRKIEEADAMIQTLLDAAVLKGRTKLKLELAQFEIMALVEEVCVDMPLLGKSVIPLGEQVLGYWCRMSMKRVLENLMANAGKYGDTAAPITVQVSTAHDRMVLSVHNMGQPIPEDKLAHLFDADKRMKEVDVKGWGLGLPFVQRVVESHGGSVFADSGAGRGTTFTVAVPIDARPFARNGDGAAAAAA